ncbi:MAG: hypothetical protein HY801_13500 [Candidatus Lindowbacteria bacterium]|nr:hypothetical protein [Candidatus Lindowbacteria bacterium]
MSSSSAKKIVFLGGGSTQFAPTLIVDFIHTRELYGSTIVLVDTSEKKLDTIFRLGKRLLDAGRADYKLGKTTDRREALAGADFVIISVEVNRFPTWENDRRIPKKLGIEQSLGANGGPGGLFHAMRQIPGIVEICEDVERLCPDALLLNLSNPMSRILQAVKDYTKVKIIGLCHEIADGNAYLSSVLDLPESNLDVLTAGLNHFTWYLKIHDKKTGEDLYPKIRNLVPENIHIDRLLVGDLLRLTGHLCVTSDSHVGEYLKDGHIWRTGWAPEMEPFDFFAYYQTYVKGIDEQVQSLIAGKFPVGEFIEKRSGEIVTDIISTAAQGRAEHFHAFNLPNDGYISNLPPTCIVEVPGWISGKRFGGEPVGPLPPILAGWCNLQTTIHYLNAKAAIEGDRQAALDALSLDPVVPDRFTAEKCLDAMLKANREYLPRFFK